MLLPLYHKGHEVRSAQANGEFFKFLCFRDLSLGNGNNGRMHGCYARCQIVFGRTHTIHNRSVEII